MLYLRIPSLPPSTNHAYTNIRGTNRRRLSDEGSSYKINTTLHMVRQYPAQLTLLRKDCAYLTAVRFWFPTLTNSGWPSKAKSKFKVLDLSNRVKLLEDCLKDAAAVDDSCTMTSVWMKRATSGDPYTEVWMWNLDEETTPFDDAINGLPVPGEG